MFKSIFFSSSSFLYFFKLREVLSSDFSSSFWVSSLVFSFTLSFRFEASTEFKIDFDSFSISHLNKYHFAIFI